MDWWRLYVPWDRLDAGCWVLLGVWLAVVAAGVAWSRHRRDREGPA